MRNNLVEKLKRKLTPKKNKRCQSDKYQRWSDNMLTVSTKHLDYKWGVTRQIPECSTSCVHNQCKHQCQQSHQSSD